MGAKARRDRAQGAKPQHSPVTPANRRRCPAKGGAKRFALHYGTDFYAKPTVPDGRRHPPFQVVDTGPENGSQEPHTICFTPQHARTRQRRPETHKRRRKTWVCEAHGHPPCRACALAHRGVRYCCARGHQGHPRVPAMCPLPRGEPPPHCAAWGRAEPAKGLQVGGRGDNPQPPRGA